MQWAVNEICSNLIFLCSKPLPWNLFIHFHKGWKLFSGTRSSKFPVNKQALCCWPYTCWHSQIFQQKWEASSQLVSHFKALQLGEEREIIQQRRSRSAVTGTLGRELWHWYTVLKLLLDALSSTRYKLHNVFKCFGEIAFWVAPSISVCPVRCREFICIFHFYRCLLASLDQESESSCVDDARNSSASICSKIQIWFPLIFIFMSKIFSSFSISFFLPLLSLV